MEWVDALRVFRGKEVYRYQDAQVYVFNDNRAGHA